MSKETKLERRRENVQVPPAAAGGTNQVVTGQESSGTNSPVIGSNSGTINIAMPPAVAEKKSSYGILKAMVAIATIMGGIAGALQLWTSYASSRAGQSTPTTVDQKEAKINQQTSGSNSPIINGNSGQVNISVPPASPTPDSQPKP